MTVLCNDGLYVQMKDLNFLFESTDIYIPISIFKLYEECLNSNTKVNDLVKIKNKSDIRFFNKLKWLISYNDFISKPKDEINFYKNKIMNKYNLLASKFNNMSENQRERNMSIVLKCDQLKYVVETINQIMYIQNGFYELNINEKDLKRNIFKMDI